MLAATAALAAAPAAARAQESAGGVAAPVAAPVAPAATASVGGVVLTMPPDATVRRTLLVHGTADPRAAGHRVKLQLQNRRTQRWKKVARARIAPDGTFTERWKPRHIGQFALRAVYHGASAPMTVTVYRPALATWYGPGFWGNATACGIVLAPDVMGVAHRSLPCGTPVALDYEGRTLIVPVIDRGPYGVAGADWDLTQATAFALGITETSTVGALRLKPQPPA
jgi:rare lipoprotein A (peptidoglycan hydrolase)